MHVYVQVDSLVSGVRDTTYCMYNNYVLCVFRSQRLTTPVGLATPLFLSTSLSMVRWLNIFPMLYPFNRASCMSSSGPDYPRQVLLLDSGMAQVVGMNTNFVTPPFATELTHILADTIAREAYYYSSGLDTIFKSSLQSGERDVCWLNI